MSASVEAVLCANDTLGCDDHHGNHSDHGGQDYDHHNHNNHDDYDHHHHHGMWMWFHTEVNDTVLFEFWVVKTPFDMVIACLILFAASVSFEALKWVRLSIERRTRRSSRSSTVYSNYISTLLSHGHLVQTLLFALQVLLGYLIMLAFMTFSVWLAAAITLGGMVGFYVFGGRYAAGATSAVGPSMDMPVSPVITVTPLRNGQY